MDTKSQYRATLGLQRTAPEPKRLADLLSTSPLNLAQRQTATARAAAWVKDIRAGQDTGLMEVFLAEYGLSTDEGVALMCLAEAFLRVPDAQTMDALIEDKIAPSDWGAHLGQSASSLVNASTWALMLTGKVLADEESEPGMASTLRGLVRRLGEPVIRTAVARAMREMGAQFVLGRTIQEAIQNGKSARDAGYTYSYDMLGEAAMTDADAQSYGQAYADAIAELAKRADKDSVAENPGISIKLSALHPRYEQPQRQAVLKELVPIVADLAAQAADANIGFNIDAEEADRLHLSLDVIAAVLKDPRLSDWAGFGIVVQAYGKAASGVIDWIAMQARAIGRPLMVRLVKGAYWDTEIKRAQVEGLDAVPVFTRKCNTDAAYLACARQLLDASDVLYAQFATHNAATVAAILEMGGDPEKFEFQRLHGMGAPLHDRVIADAGTRCRIYAPVGAHRDLLAYLVRRLLENGANSSFVNQIVDEDVPASDVAADPLSDPDLGRVNPHVRPASALYGAARQNSKGVDLHDPMEIAAHFEAKAPYRQEVLEAAPRLAVSATGTGPIRHLRNPANPGVTVGQVQEASAADISAAIAAARPWGGNATERARILTKAGDMLEAETARFCALCTLEAGKTDKDGVAEVREAVDFLRFYATHATDDAPRGTIACISPWNFPLAIFLGQISAALAAGNAVLAKPAESTPLVADQAVALLHAAGVPLSALQLLPGQGASVGAALTSDPRIDGVVFTGSTPTAQKINAAMAENLSPDAPLIAETGGLNAMIVDSTALPEQAVRDILASAFQSAGQRCSALRLLYVQEDIAEDLLTMLFGAMDRLVIGDPWDLSTDVGPVIDAAAQTRIMSHIERHKAQVLKTSAVPGTGYFVPPTVIKVNGMADLAEEIFGPVLHVATFASARLEAVIDEVNASGFGLTFGLHTRIDDRVEAVTARAAAGNIYVNRNQIGAVVGSQPFGGEGLSGTGPKAGGPAYVPRFRATALVQDGVAETAPPVSFDRICAAFDGLVPMPPQIQTDTLPGPTGESNRLTTMPRGRVLCLGPTAKQARAQAEIASALGCVALAIAPGLASAEGLDGGITCENIKVIPDLEGVLWWGDTETARALRRALAARPGAIVPLVRASDPVPWLIKERHVCVDTTAAGGNAELLAAS